MSGHSADRSPQPNTLTKPLPLAQLWAALPELHKQRLLLTLTRVLAQHLPKSPASKEADHEPR